MHVGHLYHKVKFLTLEGTAGGDMAQWNKVPGCDSHSLRSFHSHTASVIQVCPHRSSWALTGPGLHCCSLLLSLHWSWFSISTRGWPVQPGETGPADGGWCRELHKC